MQKEKYTHNPVVINGLLPAKSWKLAFLHLLIMVMVVFLTEISSVNADGLFDFQMKLAQKGNAEAQFKIGEMYETGFGVNKDLAQAKIWIDKAAAQGHEVAGFKLLYWDLAKQGVKPTNKARLEELQKLAAENNAQAQYYIGKMYARGVGLKKNTDRGLELLNKAAFVGILEAEREAVAVREELQRSQLAKRRAEQKRKAQLKAKQELERQKALEAKRKAEIAKKAAAAQAAKDRRKRAERQSAVEKALAEEQAEQQRKREERAALEREREARRQALLTQRKEREQERKEQFESDPCSGKSARFLSTCR